MNRAINKFRLFTETCIRVSSPFIPLVIIVRKAFFHIEPSNFTLFIFLYYFLYYKKNKDSEL